MSPSDSVERMSPANRRQTHAARDGASLAIEPAPGPYVADEMQMIDPPTPISAGVQGLRWLPNGRAHGLGVACSGP